MTTPNDISLYMGNALYTQILGDNANTFVEARLEEVKSYIHGMLSKIYMLPLPESPLLNEITIALVVERIYQHNLSDTIPEKVSQQAQHAHQLIQKIQNRDLEIPNAELKTQIPLMMFDFDL